MNMKAKIVSLCVAVVAGITMLNAQSGTCGANATWDLSDGVLTIRGTGEMEADPSYERLTFYRSFITSVIIYEGITGMCEYAFFECANLTSVTIPNSVTTIGEAAFRKCAALTSVTIPSSVTSIGEDAFLECTGLTSVTIPESVTSLGERAFALCKNLHAVTFPNSVTGVGLDAFGNSGLASPVYNGHVFAYLPEKYSGDFTIPEGIQMIAGGAFSNCIRMTSVTISSSVTAIGENAFWGCDSLSSISIPSGVTSIGEYAFFNCENITSVTCFAPTPPALGIHPLFGEALFPATATLYVPKGSVKAYKKSAWKKQFKHIQEMQEQ